jgi:hypothetical protein
MSTSLKGRPTLNPGEKTLIFTVRLPATQKAKLLQLGGSKWIRQQIENANPPIEKID